MSPNDQTLVIIEARSSLDLEKWQKEEIREIVTECFFQGETDEEGRVYGLDDVCDITVSIEGIDGVEYRIEHKYCRDLYGYEMSRLGVETTDEFILAIFEALAGYKVKVIKHL